jgi:hypothetical protein
MRFEVLKAILDMGGGSIFLRNAGVSLQLQTALMPRKATSTLDLILQYFTDLFHERTELC